MGNAEMETTKVMKKRAEQGDPDALFRLGYRLAYGRQRPRPIDWQQVVSLWKQAARKGHSRAQFYLGVCYDNGLGVPQDIRLAAQWYRRAAEQGHSTAQYNLGFCYLEGQGVRKNGKSARNWFYQAAMAGEINAQ